MCRLLVLPPLTIILFSLKDLTIIFQVVSLKQNIVLSKLINSSPSLKKFLNIKELYKNFLVKNSLYDIKYILNIYFL